MSRVRWRVPDGKKATSQCRHIRVNIATSDGPLPAKWGRTQAVLGASLQPSPLQYAPQQLPQMLNVCKGKSVGILGYAKYLVHSRCNLLNIYIVVAYCELTRKACHASEPWS